VEVRLTLNPFLFADVDIVLMCRSTVYMSTGDGVLELVQNAVRLVKEDDTLIILDDVGDRLEFHNVRVKEINLISNNIVLEKDARQG